MAHDDETGEELSRQRLVPAPGEPGDQTWGDGPYEDRVHVGSWTAPSVDLDLNLVFAGTSVTSPAPKFLRDGIENTHLYHDSTLALDADPARSAGTTITSTGNRDPQTFSVVPETP